MIYIKINGIYYNVQTGISILEGCLTRKVGLEIPRFCYHEILSVAGNCRMCLVEVRDMPKTVASCAMSVSEGMEFFTNTIVTKFTRENVLEFLLMNHPLDCPVCDQGGECDLQDITGDHGNPKSRFYGNKRSVVDKDMGTLIKTVMNRCIHCTRCIRYFNEINGLNELGMTGRGNDSEISKYVEKIVKSEMSGNVIDICPVGALTSKTYAFKGRSWELELILSIDPLDPLNSNISLGIRGTDLLRILPSMNINLNGELIDDRTRFSFDGLSNNRLTYVFVKKPVYINLNYQNHNNLFSLEKMDWETTVILLDNFLNNVFKNKKETVIGKYNDLESIMAIKNLNKNIGNNNLFVEEFKNKIQQITFRNDFIFKLPLDFLLDYDHLFLVGLNPSQDVPVFSARIHQLLIHKLIEIYILGSPMNFSFKTSNFLGSNINTLFEILEGRYFNKQIIQTLFILGTSYLINLFDMYNLIKYENNGYNEIDALVTNLINFNTTNETIKF